MATLSYTCLSVSDESVGRLTVVFVRRHMVACMYVIVLASRPSPHVVLRNMVYNAFIPSCYLRRTIWLIRITITKTAQRERRCWVSFFVEIRTPNIFPEKGYTTFLRCSYIFDVRAKPMACAVKLFLRYLPTVCKRFKIQTESTNCETPRRVCALSLNFFRFPHNKTRQAGIGIHGERKLINLTAEKHFTTFYNTIL